jgi:rare lipoprotein A (peptidoglycan hydrolase)
MPGRKRSPSTFTTATAPRPTRRPTCTWCPTPSRGWTTCGPLRQGGPNKPYAVLGQAYAPLQGDVPLVERGLASWYGRKFHGRSTASGETYNMYAMTAAHKTMPLPSYARVRNPANGREVIVRVNDRGPVPAGRVIDLSYTAALKLGVLGGVAPVEVERITHDDIRAGPHAQHRSHVRHAHHLCRARPQPGDPAPHAAQPRPAGAPAAAPGRARSRPRCAWARRATAPPPCAWRRCRGRTWWRCTSPAARC